MKIAFAVHGRFHSFDLAREMIRLGADVTVVTNYPRRVAARFGIPPHHVRNCLAHGIVSRVIARLPGPRNVQRAEPLLHRWFSTYAARALQDGNWDVAHAFSGVAEELFHSLAGLPTIKSMVRGSAHIATQARLLEEEEARAGVSIDKPSRWIIDRERREYTLASAIFVLSSFARDSFISEGVASAKVRLLPLGSQLSKFRAQAADIQNRCRHIESGAPLRVLTVGTFSYRKGILDLVEVARKLSGQFRFRFVGAIASEARPLANTVRHLIDFVPKVPQHELPRIYSDADIFLFQTIEDGYAVVLAQAQAAGLPLIATANCAAPDLVTDGETGWVVPIRCPEEVIKRLDSCDRNRPDLSAIVHAASAAYRGRDWAVVAADFMAHLQELAQAPDTHYRDLKH